MFYTQRRFLIERYVFLLLKELLKTIDPDLLSENEDDDPELLNTRD